jgi:transcriptional regulator with XRE-family HTH domain
VFYTQIVTRIIVRVNINFNSKEISMPNFGERLRELRNQAKVTQKQLSIDLNISERGIQSYELNEKKPGLDALISLADYFNVSLDYLVGRSDNSNIDK